MKFTTLLNIRFLSFGLRPFR